MLHKEFWGLVFLGFVVWIILASNPQVRMARTCEPIMWTGNIAASLTAFAAPGGAESVQKWTNKIDYGCRYTLWRLFYQSDYNKAMQLAGKGVPGTSTINPAKPPDGATPPPEKPTGK